MGNESSTGKYNDLEAMKKYSCFSPGQVDIIRLATTFWILTIWKNGYDLCWNEIIFSKREIRFDGGWGFDYLQGVVWETHEDSS